MEIVGRLNVQLDTVGVNTQEGVQLQFGRPSVSLPSSIKPSVTIPVSFG